MTSLRYPTEMYETGHNMSRALEYVRREESQMHGGVVSASLLKDRKCVEGGGVYLM